MGSFQVGDKEMLELAAKAADVPIDPVFGPGEWHRPVRGNKVFSEWNPLTDDGEALRLAVKMEMQVDQQGHMQRAVAMWKSSGFIRYASVDFNGDRCAATRRAITLAAAEIGKAMP